MNIIFIELLLQHYCCLCEALLRINQHYGNGNSKGPWDDF